MRTPSTVIFLLGLCGFPAADVSAAGLFPAVPPQDTKEHSSGGAAAPDLHDDPASQEEDKDTPQESLPQLRELLEWNASERIAAAPQPRLANARFQAQRAAARRFGTQAGLADKSRLIRQTLEARQAELDRIYDFRPLLIDGYMLPPVIVRGQRVFTQDDEERARQTAEVYHIVKTARITSAVPLWQDYLYQALPDIRYPDTALLPENDAERQRWRAWMRHAWQAGREQADAIFRQNLARLHRDYAGMMEYLRLRALGMASSPQLRRSTNRIITEEQSLRVLDQTLRISRQARFTDPSTWKPVPMSPPNPTPHVGRQR